jgi:hypothetical protein
MDDDPFSFLFNQRIKLFENQNRSWNSIDTKLSLMLTQAFLFIGFAFNMLKGLELLLLIPIVIAILLYVIGIWPQNQVTMLTPELFSSMTKFLSENQKITLKDFYRSFSCIDDKNILETLDDRMISNIKTINTKSILFEIGVIMNIIGVIYIIIVALCK